MFLVELEEELIQRLGLLFQFASGGGRSVGRAHEQAVLFVGPVQTHPSRNGVCSGNRIVVLRRFVFHRILSLVSRQALDRRKPYREPASRRPLSIRFGPKRRAGSESLSRCVDAQGKGDSSSQPGVTPFGQAKAWLLTSKYFHGAKVIHRRLRREEARLSSPPMNNFGTPIRDGVRGRGSWVASFRFCACVGTMNLPRAVSRRDSVLDCGSPLPLLLPRAEWESARGLAQSKPVGH